jgi:hypothetical protein
MRRKRVVRDPLAAAITTMFANKFAWVDVDESLKRVQEQTGESQASVAQAFEAQFQQGHRNG